MIIDASPPPSLPEPDVRDWASEQGFFISSVMGDTKAERDAAATALRDKGGSVSRFEELGGRNDDAQRAYLTEVERCDVYVGIIRASYGSRTEHGLSPTHIEYRRADELGKVISVWIAEDRVAPDRDRDTVRLIEEVRARHTTGTYSSPSDLAANLIRRVATLAAEDIAPWVKLGQYVFRATSVRLDRDAFQVTARLRPGDVLAGLEGLPDERADRTPLLTVRGRSVPVAVRNVSTTVVTASRTEVRIDGRIVDPVQRFPLNFSSGRVSVSAEEAVGLRLREQLFGERVAGDHFHFWCDFELDQSVLRDPAMSDEIAAGLIRLLVVEALVGGGCASRVLSVAVSPRTVAGRRVRVGWLDLRRYTNVEPQARWVDGVIPRS